MNAPILQNAFQTDSWPEAIAKANAWRGRCINSFARAETAVSETLLILDDGSGVGLQHLIGQRFEAIEKALLSGEYGSEHPKLPKVLAAFRQHDSLRPFLCHGVGKVTLDRAGEWQIVLRVLTFRMKEASRSVLVIDQREAATIADSLQKAEQRLSTELAKLRKPNPD